METYIGEKKKHKKKGFADLSHGKGVLFSIDGKRYIGEFKNGEKAWKRRHDIC